jgi:hypothetical protein
VHSVLVDVGDVGEGGVPHVRADPAAGNPDVAAVHEVGRDLGGKVRQLAYVPAGQDGREITRVPEHPSVIAHGERVRSPDLVDTPHRRTGAVVHRLAQVQRQRCLVGPLLGAFGSRSDAMP